MSVIGLFAGTHSLVAGVEDDPQGGVRVYLAPRIRGLYCSIPEGPDAQHARDTWNSTPGHVTIPTPPLECIFSDAEDRCT